MSASKSPGSVGYFDAGASQYEKTSGDCTRDLARSVVDLPQLASMYSPDALVLDNAAGPGIIAEEIILHARKTGKSIPPLRVVEPAPNMIALADAKLSALGAGDTCTTHVMLGEELGFPDDTFTHSITNLGLMFFSDGPQGVKEIYRTLKPGGVAVITCWSFMGYIDGVIRPSQAAARPSDPPYQIPLPTNWFQPEYVEKVLTEDGGFSDVVLGQRDAHFGAPTLEELGTLLGQVFTYLYKDWSAAEQEKFKEAMNANIAKVAEPYTMVSGQPGFGIPMTAIVAISQK
ncbi:hypothetical protein PT974_02236 [Cladobotryum mycophilum]|uniref:Methyltransferase type 11 domain-containing protein n=1 Tax=Cladobotryum mycophilum TaxID=491253 RepID=A0ABR0SXZ8_9HYPO